MKHKIKNIHFIGIGGVGMCGIAEILCYLGYKVTGSDIVESYNTERLKNIGIKIFSEHLASNVVGSDVVVSSTAVKENNPEIVAAKKLCITIVPRAQMLAELMRFKYGIAIAGTHGKTTTTSLCAEVLSCCGLDPTFLVGGKLAVSSGNAQLGSGDYLVAEADESDASFLYLNPLISVVTNIDLDHMETYDYDERKLKKTFIDFVHRLPFYGVVILCNEDKMVRDIIPEVNRKIITYGFSKDCDIFAKNITAYKNKMQFIVCIKEDNFEFPVTLNLCGEHNVLNALASIAVAFECEGNLAGISAGLANFHGVSRRCQHYPDLFINDGYVKLIDDYGHHPSEITATINALRAAYPSTKITMIFQPHRYSRTRDLFNDFIIALNKVDTLIITDTYSAGEEWIEGADGMALAEVLKQNSGNVEFVRSLDDAKDAAYRLSQPGNLLITMGAGSIGKLPQIMVTEKGIRGNI